MFEGFKGYVLLYKLSKSLSGIDSSLKKLAETQDLKLKLDLIRSNITLADLKEATEMDKNEFESTTLTQTDSQLAKINEMLTAYKEVTGHEPLENESMEFIAKVAAKDPTR